MPQQPSVGRIVHFHEAGGPYPAIITAINADGTVELATLGRNSLYFQHGIYESPGGPVKGCWNWPPVVPPAAAPKPIVPSSVAPLPIEVVARACHEVNRAYCLSQGDLSQPSWDAAPEWQRASAIAGVRFHREHPDSIPAHSHEAWLEQKRADGWKFGPVKDPEKKEHPCFVPYADLPKEQQAKDYLFLAVVRSLS